MDIHTNKTFARDALIRIVAKSNPQGSERGPHGPRNCRRSACAFPTCEDTNLCQLLHATRSVMHDKVAVTLTLQPVSLCVQSSEATVRQAPSWIGKSARAQCRPLRRLPSSNLQHEHICACKCHESMCMVGPHWMLTCAPYYSRAIRPFKSISPRGTFSSLATTPLSISTSSPALPSAGSKLGLSILRYLRRRKQGVPLATWSTKRNMARKLVWS